jgi:hypothetical protein
VPDTAPGHPVEKITRKAAPGHRQRRVAEGHTAWSDEQLWMGRLGRAGKVPYLPTVGLGAIARRAGLNDGRLARLLDWNAGQAEPVAVLPGGQTIERTAPSDIADR